MWLVGLYLLSRGVSAESLESYYLARLAQAHSPQQVEELKTTYEHTRVSRTACQIQLADHTMPLSCYEWVHFANLMNFKDTGVASIHQLDRLCATAASQMKVEGEENSYLSTNCQQKLREFREIQAYRGEDGDAWSEN